MAHIEECTCSGCRCSRYEVELETLRAQVAELKDELERLNGHLKAKNYYIRGWKAGCCN